MQLAQLLTTIAKLPRPDGVKAIVADSLLLKQQILIVNRSPRRAPNLKPVDRMLLGIWPLFLSPHGIQRAAVILKPSTLLKFHDILKRRIIERSRTHASLDGNTPADISGDSVTRPVQLYNYACEPHCSGLFQLPIAA